MTPSMEQRLNRVQAAARSDLGRLMREHEEKLVNKLVLNWNSGTLTNEMLWGTVASIATLRQVASQAEHDFLKATDEFERYNAGAQNA